MPRFLAAVTLLVTFLCVTNSDAQVVGGVTRSSMPTGTSASTFNGVDPRSITYTPVNTAAAMRQFNTSNMAMPTTNQASSPLSLSNMFRGFSLPSWPPKLASAPVVPQKQNQFQPQMPKGQYTFPPAASQK